MDDSLDQLWDKFRTSGATQDRNSLVVALLPFVRRQAEQVAARIHSAAIVDVEDLVQAAIPELISLVERYDEAHGASITTYAMLRVKGAMFDMLRSLDWVCRSDRQAAKLDPSHTIVSIVPLATVIDRVNPDNSEPLEPLVEDPPCPLDDEFFWRLVCAGFDKVDRLIMLLIYREGISFVEIARRLSCCEQTISNRHRSILKRLRDRPELKGLSDDWLG